VDQDGRADPARKRQSRASLPGSLTRRGSLGVSADQELQNCRRSKNKNQSWCQHRRYDAFILQKLEANNIPPSPDASKETLLRRAYTDLIGMPPSPAEVQAFIADQTPQAWEKVIDKLWRARTTANAGVATGWIAPVMPIRSAATLTPTRRKTYRYAHAWTYRDYVVRAINEDKPYDSSSPSNSRPIIFFAKPTVAVTKSETAPAQARSKGGAPIPLNLGR
jgi:hypothetical protein